MTTYKTFTSENNLDFYRIATTTTDSVTIVEFRKLRGSDRNIGTWAKVLRERIASFEKHEEAQGFEQYLIDELPAGYLIS